MTGRATRAQRAAKLDEATPASPVRGGPRRGAPTVVVKQPARDGAGGRREAIIEAAAQRFARAGYDATTMRDIASLTGLLPGSLYYYFRSKEELFVAVHEEAIRRISESVRAAVVETAPPWTRLEQAAAAYLESMLNDPVYASLIVTEFPRRRLKKLRDVLISHRNSFEQVFADIIAELPLARGFDRKYWRLALMGMLAWTYVWYRPGQDSPAAIAHALLKLLRKQTLAEARGPEPAA